MLVAGSNLRGSSPACRSARLRGAACILPGHRVSQPPRGLVAIKVGGGLSAVQGALDRVCGALVVAREAAPLVVLPGGGPFADSVRAFDRAHRLPASTAHWMAILAMDQYAHALASLVEGARLVDDPAGIGDALAAGAIPVLAPFRWLRAADPLPQEWAITSDSLAAWMAGALGADRLVLIKPVAGGPELVDERFVESCPRNLQVTCLPVAAVDGLAELLAP